VLDCLCNTQKFLCYLNQHNGDDAPQDGNNASMIRLLLLLPPTIFLSYRDISSALPFQRIAVVSCGVLCCVLNKTSKTIKEQGLRRYFNIYQERVNLKTVSAFNDILTGYTGHQWCS